MYPFFTEDLFTKWSVLTIPLLLVASLLHGQHQLPQHLIRIYEDNDAINVFRKPTDEAYSNGTRVDYFYAKKRPTSLFGLIKHDSGSVFVDGISIMQVMITPRDYSKSYRQPNDYPYAGALYATKSLFVSNAIHKCNLETELVVGVMGPYAYAGQIQTLVHAAIGNDKPMGWANQLPTDILLNLNITAEKQIFYPSPWLEVLVGQSISLGTMLDAFSIYSTIRLGRMNSYFQGYFSQFSRGATARKSQVYFVARPSTEFVARNALLQGGMLLSSQNTSNQDKSEESTISPQMVTASIDVGVVAVIGNVSLSLMQKTMTSVLRGLPSHSVGNLSITFAW